MSQPALEPVTTSLKHWFDDIGAYFYRPITIFKSYRLAYLRPDLIACFTVAVVMLPQAMAYALIAELPPQMGLYAAIVASIVGVLWGSSTHLHTGPTNTTSLLVLSTLTAVAVAGTPHYIVATGLLTIMVGIVRLGMGLARLGVLVNFVADSVIIGFTAGAGVLIGVNQLRYLLRINVPSIPGFLATVSNLGQHIVDVHTASLVLGLLVIVTILLCRRFRPNWRVSEFDELGWRFGCLGKRWPANCYRVR